MSCRDLAITKKRHLRRSSRAACGIFARKRTLIYSIQPLHCVGTHTSHTDWATTLQKVKHQITKTWSLGVFFPSYTMESQECSQNKPKHQPHALHSGYLILKLSLMYVNTEWSFRNLKGPKWHISGCGEFNIPDMGIK